ncbi:hypothetical protein [Pseudochelatococcus lubricantis]|nr:hypothetical protein [Pseudochelatococcus lubricantis]
MARERFAFLASLVVVAGGVAVAHATPAETVETAGPPPAAVVRDTPAAPPIPYPGMPGSIPGSLAPSPYHAGDTPRAPDASQSTLAPAPADAGGVDEVDIAPRKTLVLSSQAEWAKGFESLSAAFRLLDEIAIAAGFDVKGRPFAIFTRTDDNGFSFDAMLPVEPDGGDAAAQEALRQAAAEHVDGKGAKDATADAVRLGLSPSGKAYRFVHASPYDDIETTYEAVTAWLDSRNIVVRDAFIEEYVTDLTDPTDEALEVYIYVQPVDAPGGKAPAPQPQEGAGTPKEPETPATPAQEPPPAQEPVQKPAQEPAQEPVQEPARQEPARQEPARQEPARQEPARDEPPAVVPAPAAPVPGSGG